MDKEEIRKLIEEEKKQLHLFLELANRLKLNNDEIEKQVNFYLDQINELKKKYGDGPGQNA